MAAVCFIEPRRAISDEGELIRALAHEARELGADVTCAPDLASAEPESVCVYPAADVHGAPGAPSPGPGRQRRSIAVCLAPPSGPLDAGYINALRAAACVTPDPAGARALRARGADVVEVELGHSEGWAPGGSSGEVERTVDVACFARRGLAADRLLAAFARPLWRRRCHLLGAAEVPTDAPSPVGGPVRGEDRARLLAATSVLIVGIGDEGATVEALRALQATACGSAVCAPHGLPLGSLRPGRDFAPGEPRNLGYAAAALLVPEGEAAALAQRAADAVGSGPALRPAAEALLAKAEEVARARKSGASRRRSLPGASAGAQVRLSGARDGLRDRLRPPPNPRRVAAKRRALAEISERRRTALAEAGPAAGEAALVHETPAYESAQPRISVCVPLYRHAKPVVRALSSLIDSETQDFELLICDDGSGDGSVAAARGFLERRPWLPARLLARGANRGLGPGRNEMAAAARGEMLFMLDADNEVYPTALGRLADALAADPGAAFAYSLIEAHTQGRPRTLLSSLPWDPRRLRLGNYIDAMSMLRRSALLDAGGYTDDLRLHGWEDFDLWCRFAEQGLRGLLVPEVLCRYSLADSSMIAVTNLDSSEAWTLLTRRYPATLGGAPQPVEIPPPADVAL